MSTSSFTRTERKHLQDIFVIPRQLRRVFRKLFLRCGARKNQMAGSSILRIKVHHTTRENEQQMVAFCSTAQKPCRITNTIPESDYLRHCTSLVATEAKCIFVGPNLLELLARSAMSNEATSFSFHLCPSLLNHRHMFYFRLHICFNNTANVIRKIKI